MKLHVVHTGMFKLDGGAMFGVVPKQLWQRLTTPDENNLCPWAMRCLLVEHGDRRILIDTGMGTKQDEKFMSRFEPHGDQSLEGSLSEIGFKPDDITDVFLTHLHFDHGGGALKRNESGDIVPTFPNALYWTSATHYASAINPNARERASFLKENILPLEEHGVLRFIEEKHDAEWIEGIHLHFCYGHTEAMMLPKITVGSETIVFCADLIPSSYHVRMPYIMAYDIQPLLTLEERKAFYAEAIEHNYVLFLEHDPETECIRLGRDEKGRVGVAERFALADLDLLS